MTEVLSGVLQFLLVASLAFAVLVLIASYVRFQNLATRAVEAPADSPEAQDALHLSLIQRLGTLRREPMPFAVLLVTLDTAAATDALREELLGHLERTFQRQVRPQDSVVRHGDRVALLLGVTRAQAEGVARRLLGSLLREPYRSALAPTPLRLAPRGGLATFPENGRRAQVLLDAAIAALDLAAPRPPEERWAFAPTEEAPSPAPPAPPSTPAHATTVPEGVVDPLTGVLRPEKLVIAAQKFIAQLRRDALPVAVLRFEVDHFERYATHYGRSAGDDILRGLGALLQHSVREEDLLARSGPHEFAVLLSCSTAQALLALQRLAGQIKRAAFSTGGTPLRVTISGGAAGFPEHGGAARPLLEAAGIALRTARARGRNLCLLYEPTMGALPTTPEPAGAY